jgi:mono/diheme cytochrome c family protein
MRFIAGFIAALIVLALAGLILMYSGAYNVAASVPDPKFMDWILSATMQRSVAKHAQATNAPAQLSEEQAKEGAHLYNETCIYCHGAPGKDPEDIGKGLNPEPPFLPDTIEGWSTAEVFWIVKNGIKMTGMPSFGASHKDDEIWKVVAFVKKLPKMTPDQYKQMTQAPQPPAPATPAAPSASPAPPAAEPPKQ